MTIRLLIAGAVAGFGLGVFACTGMYAGKKVSEDGTVLLGRTVDAPPWNGCHRYVTTPRVENVPGRVYRSRKAKNTFEWPLPATTWKYVATPRVSNIGSGVMDSACANERGFVISGTVTAGPNAKVREADPFNRASGVGENTLPGVLALCCSTAREALDLLAEIIAKCGHENGEIYMFADRDEAWYVEVYSGHQWAAVRMPEDKVACWGNQFMIRSFNPDSPDVRHSPDLIGLAERGGFLVRGEDGLPDLFRSYVGGLGDYANYRTWFGHRTFAPETAGEYKTSKAMPLFFDPARKIGYRDMFELMRSRFEGVNCPEETGNPKIRVIGTTKQSTSHVISLDPTLPAPLRGTVWASMGNCEHTVFMPLNAAITRCDDAFTLDQTNGWFRYDANIACAAFRRLAALAELNRTWYGGDVRKFWHDREDEYLATYPKLLKEAAATWETDPTAAMEKLTAFTVAAQRKDFESAKRVFDQLMWYITANNRIEGDGSGATTLPTKPFKVAR